MTWFITSGERWLQGLLATDQLVWIPDHLIAFIGQPHLSQFDPELVVECYSAEVVQRLEQRGENLTAAA